MAKPKPIRPICRQLILSIVVTVFAVTNLSSSHGQIILSEVLYDILGSDDQLEWVELHNVGFTPVDLSNFSIGYGGIDYTFGVYQLSGVILPSEYYVVGGPLSNEANSFPVYDLAMAFDPNIQNSGTAADGVALFNVLAAKVTSSTIPIDVVIYGETNSNNLIDETGAAGTVDVGDAVSGQSLEFSEGIWIIQVEPTPGSGMISEINLGDLNLDGTVNLLDVAPFVQRITTGVYQPEADCNQDAQVSLLDIQPFVEILTN